MSNSKLEHFREIEFEKPSEVIIRQIRSLISEGVLKPGDRLPSERALSARFKVGRGHIREAIRRLEFYGILKTLPQAGTVVASIGAKALEGLIANVLDLERDDLESLMETRALLEVQATRLAAERADERQVAELEDAHLAFRAQVDAGEPGLEEDLLFHLKIAEICGNSVLRSLISLITPDIITMCRSRDSCREGRFKVAFREHEKILYSIMDHDSEAASQAMQVHMGQALFSVVRDESPSRV